MWMLQPLAADEVLVRVTASGICASDVDAVSGKYPAAMYQFPMVAGHEGITLHFAACKIHTLQRIGFNV